MAQAGRPARGARRRGWRGAAGESRAPARFNWQRTAGEQQSAQVAGGSRKTRWSLAAYALLGLLLLGLFVRALLFVPPRTPFVLVAPSLVAPYEGPLAPDAWIAEDVERFRQLDEATSQSAGTLTIHATCRDWHSVSQGLDGIRQQLRELARHDTRSDSVVIYVSMHGAVNDSGEPCLILPSGPGVSPLESGSWIRVAELLAAIEEAGFRRNVVKLLVLDSGRFRVNWGMGTLYNTFATELQNVVEARDVPNLVVLNSTSPGEVAWTSAELQGSVFAHYLQRGLSGEADDRSAGGNADRMVSLAELSGYVRQRVAAWVQHNRGEHQHPLLLSSGTLPGDKTVAWALRPHERRRLFRPMDAMPQASDANELNSFWTRYAQLQQSGAATVDPLTWAQLQQSLVRLEHCLSAGQAYATAARDARASVIGAFRSFERLSASSGDCLIGARQRSLDVVGLLPAHSLPLADAFGAVSDEELQAIHSVIDALSDEHTEPTLAAAIEQLQAAAGAQRFAEVHFVSLLQQYRVDARYPQVDVVAPAVRLRRWAERAAVPCDERLLVNVRQGVDAADAARRGLEDDLFAGQAFAAADWDAALARYEQEVQRQRQVTADLRWRDDTLADLPWLAQWLTCVALRPAAENHEQLDGEIADDLRSLIEALCSRTADEFLDSTEVQDLRIRYQLLHARITGEYSRLLAATEVNGEYVRDAQALLELPLLPGDGSDNTRFLPEHRATLRTRIQQWSAQLAAETPPLTDAAASTTADADRGARFLERIENSWRYHPAVRIVSDAESNSGDQAPDRNPSARLVAREARLRQILATLPVRLQSVRDTTYRTAEEARTAWSDAARLTRSVAALNYVPLEVNAPLTLRKLDLEQLLLWQAQRTLDDFYGSRDAQQAFFATAAEDYISAAAEIAPERTLTRDQAAALSQLLTQRRELAQRDPARRTLVERASDVVIIDEHVPTATSLVVSSVGPNSGVLPPGVAALYIDEVPLDPIALPTVGLPLEASAQFSVPLPVELLQQLPTDAAVRHAGILSFRGHEFSAPFEVARIGGSISRFVPQPSDAVEVLVIGPQQRPPDLLFVLDCSASMQQPADLEGGTARRFDAAMTALRPLLQNIARQESMRVGVVLFGHRVRWDHDNEGQVLPQSNYRRTIPPGQMPYDDVETVLPVGRFDSTIAAQLFRTMDSVTPWGESPLYLALVQSLQQLPVATDGRPQSIVVVTDGVNKQFNAPRAARKDLPDVFQALAGRRVPIHVVGFGIPAEEAAAAQQAYQQLAQATEGSYTPINEAAELLEYLQGLISRESFTVEDSGLFHATSAVGSPELVSRISSLQQPLTVSASDAQIQLIAEGGEAFRLQLSPDGVRLMVEPYLAGNPRFHTLTGQAGAFGLRPSLVVHRPLRRQGPVEFEFSLQDRDGLFVPKPQSVWIEVTPILSSGQRGDKYVFYDRNFRPGVSVPVLRWLAEDWPVDAAQAEVDFFCRFDEFDPDEQIPVPAGADAGALHTVALPQPADGTLTIERYEDDFAELRVIEQYASAPGFPAVRVRIVTPGGAIDAVRRFDAGHRIAVHQFHVPLADAALFDRAELHITRRDRERIGAWQLADPIRVDIATSDGLIVPSAP